MPPFYQVDAFATEPFSGNPAAICLLPVPADAAWMQRVAAEINLSETAFLVPRGVGEYDLRWFTRAAEVDLCGHATLASAHILWQEGHLPLTAPTRFWTKSGWLTAARRGDWIELDFPVTREVPTAPPEGLLEALGVEASYVGKTRFDYLVEVSSEAVVRALAPDFARLGRLPVRGVIVTSRSADPDVDFVSRFFAPAVGIDEDPVTGSAHCALAPYWHRLLGRIEFRARQLSARGGLLGITLAGDRVHLRGQAVTIVRGELVA